MKNPDQRKHLREAIRLAELTLDDNRYIKQRLESIVELLKQSDEIIKNLVITNKK